MTDAFDTLNSALNGRYRIERELGRGGMATVYLARDEKHGRQVALKVLHPQVAALLGPERFEREITTTAHLNHPGILPLFDSGTEQGVAWYAMPYFAGRTLGDRLRDGPLPLGEALRIFADVASALDFAHRQGILHRDLKPANILLQEERAVLADFGIALPMGGAVERLTEAGLSVGTPEYMSPEQATAERVIDGRSDIYALGCVLYEMLAGEPPFTGPTAHAVLAKRIREPVPRISTLREVPPSIEAAITRALAREPADRFTTVAEFASAVAGATGAPSGPRARWREPRLIASLLVLGVAGWIALRARSSPASALDPSLVAVVPFRVSAPGAGLEGWEEGMVDVVAVKLTGQGGPRAADPRATLAAWHSITAAGVGADAATRLARRVGAGSVLDGSIVGDAHRIVLSAHLTSPGGGAKGEPVSVEGPPDSVTALIDRLLIRLLASRSGENQRSLAEITSLPAWRAYLQGKAAFRDGRYADAVTAFQQALAADSTFAIAALAIIPAKARLDQGAESEARLVYRNLGRLSADDSLWFYALVGPDYPGASSVRDNLQQLEVVVRRLPDRADAWLELGDAQLHFGALADLDSSLGYAARSLGRAVALDSSFALPMDHLLLIAYQNEDTIAIRKLMRLYVAHQTLGERMGFFRWRSALALGDSGTLRQIRQELPGLPDESLYWIVGLPEQDGLGLEDAIRGDSVLTARAATDAERGTAAFIHGSLMLNLGRPSRVSPADNPFGDLDDALFGDGVHGAAAARSLRGRGALRRPATGFDEWLGRWMLGCWDLTQGDTAGARSILAELRRFPPAAAAWNTTNGTDSLLAPLLLESWLAVEQHSANASALVDRLDSLAATGPSTWLLQETPLLLARMFLTLDQPEQAVRALRRQGRLLPAQYMAYRAPLALARARAAARASLTTEAIESYQLYLALRFHPEESLVPQRDSARAELARLVSR